MDLLTDVIENVKASNPKLHDSIVKERMKEFTDKTEFYNSLQDANDGQLNPNGKLE